MPDDLIGKVFERFPDLAVLAVIAYGVWRGMLRAFVEQRSAIERVVTDHREALRELGKNCHEAHAVIAAEFREATERLAEQHADQAARGAAIGAQLHQQIGESNELKRRTVAVLERIDREGAAA